MCLPAGHVGPAGPHRLLGAQPGSPRRQLVFPAESRWPLLSGLPVPFADVRGEACHHPRRGVQRCRPLGVRRRRSADRRGGTGRGTGRGEEAEEEDEGEPDDRRRDGEVIDLGVGVVLADADDGVGDRLRFGFCGAVHELGPGQC